MLCQVGAVYLAGTEAASRFGWNFNQTRSYQHVPRFAVSPLPTGQHCCRVRHSAWVAGRHLLSCRGGTGTTDPGLFPAKRRESAGGPLGFAAHDHQAHVVGLFCAFDKLQDISHDSRAVGF